MSRNRRVTLRDLKAARAPGLCIETACGKPVNGFSKLFCSAMCKRHALYRTRPTYLRNAVYSRDKGICALCGADTEAQRKEWLASGRDNAVKIKYHVPASRDTFWDADHIQQIDQGGDWTDLKNLRTLCIKCHRGETDEFLAARKLLRHKWLETGKRMQWVDVKDRLPPATGFPVPVLIYISNFMMVGEYRTTGFHVGPDPEDFTIGEVTHWMPMPEPPESPSSRSPSESARTRPTTS